MLADDLEYAAIAQLASIIVAAGYLDGKVYFELSNDRGVTKSTFADGSTRIEIADADKEQPSIEVLTTRELVVALTRDAKVVSYLSQDWGEQWTVLDQL